MRFDQLSEMLDALENQHVSPTRLQRVFNARFARERTEGRHARPTAQGRTLARGFGQPARDSRKLG